MQHDILHDDTLDEANLVHVGCDIEHGIVDEQGHKQGTMDEHDRSLPKFSWGW